MILLLTGCASLFYDGRLWLCDTEVRTPTFIADGPIQVRDAGFAGPCRAGAYGRYFPRPYDEDEHDLFPNALQLFEEVEEVELTGVNTLNIAWGQRFAESVEANPDFEGGNRDTRIDLVSRVASSEGPTRATTLKVRATNTSIGVLSWTRYEVGAEVEISCTDCSVQVNGITTVNLIVGEGAHMRICGKIDGSITMNGGLVELDRRPTGLQVNDHHFESTDLNYDFRLYEGTQLCF